MTRQDYLSRSSVREFVQYLAGLINGTHALDFPYCFHPRFVPAGFVARFGLSGTAGTLESLFDRYHWAGDTYQANAVQLESMRDMIRVGVEQDEGQLAAAIVRLMAWGFGSPNVPAARHNIAWAEQQQERLPIVLQRGRDSLNSDAASAPCRNLCASACRKLAPPNWKPGR